MFLIVAGGHGASQAPALGAPSARRAPVVGEGVPAAGCAAA